MNQWDVVVVVVLLQADAVLKRVCELKHLRPVAASATGNRKDCTTPG